jgi:hypothetical protein
MLGSSGADLEFLVNEITSSGPGIGAFVHTSHLREEVKTGDTFVFRGIGAANFDPADTYTVTRIGDEDGVTVNPGFLFVPAPSWTVDADKHEVGPETSPLSART